jgi:hypothetical protein
MTIENLFNTTESENASIPNVDKRKMAKLYYFMYNQPRNRVERNIYQKLLHSFTKEERKYISNNSLGDDKETKSKISIFEQMITMRKDIEPILKHYNLPMDYNMRFCLLIIYNTFKNFNDYDSIYILDKEYDLENGIRHETEKGKVLVFVCNQNISKNKFKKWIDENWNSKIKERMNKLPSQPTKFSKNLEIFEEIDLLRKNGEKFSEISSRLTDNFPENSIFMDTETIRNSIMKEIQNYASK